MSKVNRNHYIPQCYLGSWELTGEAISWQIGVYFRNEPYCKKPIKRTAKRHRFYESKLEIELQKIETKYGLILPKIEAGSQLSAEERRCLVVFITTLLRRNPVGKERITRLLMETIPERREVMIQNLWRNLNATFFGPLVEKLIVGIAFEFVIRGAYASLERGLPKDMFTDLTLIGLPEFEEILARLDWVFYLSDSSAPFVTCDNPVIMPESGLISEPNVVLPIGPNICLMTEGKPSSARARTLYRPANSSFVAKCNEMVIASADEAVYAASDCLSQDQLNKMGTRIWMAG